MKGTRRMIFFTVDGGARNTDMRSVTGFETRDLEGVFDVEMGGCTLFELCSLNQESRLDRFRFEPEAGRSLLAAAVASPLH